MDKTEITDALQQEFENISFWFENHTDDTFQTGPDTKWTAGQHLDHLIKCTIPLNMAMGAPKFFLRFLVGTADRESREFEEVVDAYKQALDGGGKAVGRYIPRNQPAHFKEPMLDSFKKEGKRLSKTTHKWSESDLDKYMLSHPLEAMGKMTVREMLMFTIYHMQHHLNALKSDYE